MFSFVDRDGGSSIDAEELSKLLDLLGMSKNPDEIQTLMNHIDTEGKGKFNFCTFVHALKAGMSNPRYTEEMSRMVFSILPEI